MVGLARDDERSSHQELSGAGDFQVQGELGQDKTNISRIPSYKDGKGQSGSRKKIGWWRGPRGCILDPGPGQGWEKQGWGRS